MVYPQLTLEKGRTNVLPVTLGVAVPEAGSALKAEIRTGPSEQATLVATWSIQVVDAAAGEIVLTLTPAWADALTADTVYTDVIIIAGDRTLMPVLECTVIEGVTAA